MMVTLASLQAMVTGATEAQTKAAVADYSHRNQLRLYTEITRNALNSKAYDLPSDFLFLVKLAEIAELSGFYVAGGLLTFTVRPDSDSLHIWYAAQHTLDETDTYPFLNDDDAAIIALKLQSLVAGAANGGVTEYKIGDVQVKRDVNWLETAYLDAIKAKVGPVGIRSRYTELDLLGLR